MYSMKVILMMKSDKPILGLDVSKYQHYIDQLDKSSIFVAGSDNKAVDKTKNFDENFPVWVAYYRKFPHKFAEDYLGIMGLKDFQKVILYDMSNSNYTMFLASRGLGKSFLTALFAVIMCILYPEIKVVVASAVKSQAMKLITEKIPELQKFSLTKVLDVGKEITQIRTSMNTDEPNVDFANGSTIKIVPSTQNARSARANILILDEFRMIDFKVYQSVLRRFLAPSRQPQFMNKAEYREYPLERNKEIFLTSAWYRFHWCYDRYKMFYNNMASGNKTGYSLIALPYQVAIKERLVNPDQLIDVMKEDRIDPTLWAIEMLTIFYGENENAYYKYDKLSMCRLLHYPYVTKHIEDELNIKEFKVPPKQTGEIRVVSADIALMSGVKNDNTVVSILSAYPNKTHQHYIREVKYIEVISGGKPLGFHALRIRQIFYEFNCDYIVLDTNGIGMQVYGDLVRDSNDPDTNTLYYGLGCMNDDSMQELVPNQEADRIIFSVKADANFNKMMNSSLQADINRRHIRFLKEEQEADDMLAMSKKYPEWTTTVSGLAIYNKAINSYKQTTNLINEMINLELVDIEKIKLKEQAGKRKDRFSSVAYGNYFITTLEIDLFNKKDVNWGSWCVSSSSQGYNKNTHY